MRVASIFESFIDTSEDDTEILDVSQHIKKVNPDPEPVDDLNFVEETDEDSGADEGLGSEIIDPKEIHVETEEGPEFSTKVCNLNIIEYYWALSPSGWESGAEGDLILLARGDGGGVVVISTSPCGKNHTH